LVALGWLEEFAPGQNEFAVFCCFSPIALLAALESKHATSLDDREPVERYSFSEMFSMNLVKHQLNSPYSALFLVF
jgi:hypothetical protein